MTTMEERYTVELRGRDPETVDTLFLDNSKGGKLAGINDKLTNLTLLSLVKCELTSLTGFPLLPTLSYLDVSDNKLGNNSNLEVLVQNAPELERLTLAGNDLGLNDLSALKDLEKLSELDLSNNAKLGEDYRDEVFAIIPSLKILDGCDVDGNEVDEDFGGEGGESDGEDSGEEGPGLSYLEGEQFSDDETSDYVPKEKRGTKRGAVESSDAQDVKKPAK